MGLQEINAMINSGDAFFDEMAKVMIEMREKSEKTGEDKNINAQMATFFVKITNNIRKKMADALLKAGYAADLPTAKEKADLIVTAITPH